MYYTNKMTKQQGLGEYGKQRFRKMISSIKDENFEKDKKLWTSLGRLWVHPSPLLINEQEQTK
jgi:hypothetical protein